MSSHLSPIEAERRRQKQRSFVIGGAGFLVVALLIAFTVYSRFTSVKVDRDTNCPVDPASLVGYTAVLVDATDALNENQLNAVRRIVREEARALPRHGKLEIYSLSDSHDLLRLHFARCATDPGGEGLGLTSNPRLQKERWERTFWNPLSAFLDSLAFQPEAPRTPLMESIQRLVFRSPLEDAPHLMAQGWRLIIVSDLLQHSDTLSLYQPEAANYDTFKASPDYYSLLADLRGAHVVIHFVHRSSAARSGLQNRDLAEFWNRWFSACRSETFRLIRLIG